MPKIQALIRDFVLLPLFDPSGFLETFHCVAVMYNITRKKRCYNGYAYRSWDKKIRCSPLASGSCSPAAGCSSPGPTS